MCFQKQQGLKKKQVYKEQGVLQHARKYLLKEMPYNLFLNLFTSIYNFLKSSF